MKRKNYFKISYLIFVWLIVLLLITVSVIVTVVITGQVNYVLISTIVAFASFIATSFFSISIYNHNNMIREQNAEIRRQTEAVNRRAELFRNLQFMAGNYTIIDFVDHMLIYDESERYIKKLEETKHFNFYLLEQGINKDDVLNNFNDYAFLTVKLPIKIVEGKTIGKISLLKMKFDKENSTHIFVPPEGNEAAALILYSETDHRSETIMNLIMKKTSGFYKTGEINNFLKIKINLNMESLLSVIVSGSIELYFTNPEKIEKSGANRYKINSSQFELIGKPYLNIEKEYNAD